jgi:hypothetical protein
VKNVYRNLVVIIGILLVVAMFTYAAETAPGTVILKGAPMGGVKFDHKAHEGRGVKCDTCHHAAKPEKAPKSAHEACQDCHTTTATAPMKTKAQAAFHNPAATAGIAKDDVIKKGELNQAFDLLLLPNDSVVAITGNEERSKDETVPPEYRSGIGDEGVEAIKQFVASGGTLVTLSQASAFVIEKLGLKVQNLLKDRPGKQFFCPGSTLRARFDPAHPLAYGMPGEGLLFFWDSPAFKILPSPFNERYEVVVRYPVEMDTAAEVDDKITRELLHALQKPPRLRLVGTGTPNIQPVAGPQDGADKSAGNRVA